MATLLPIAKQLDEADRRCADHGHHRQGTQTSVRLSSRDDVWGALMLQHNIIVAFSKGWWPSTPQERGGRIPFENFL